MGSCLPDLRSSKVEGVVTSPFLCGVVAVALAAVGAAGCISQDKSCSDDSDCFEGEVCRSGQCVSDEASQGPGGDATGTDVTNSDANGGDAPGDDDACTPKTWYLDEDDDGFGTSETTERACEKPEGYVANDGDCDDTEEEVNPDAEEICNQRDDNCVDGVDEGFDVGESCTKGTGVCEQTGEMVCSGGNSVQCNVSPNAGAKHGELCLDGLDNDCDGETDEKGDAVGVGFAELEVGADHFCGATEEGKLYCWGNNFESGTLGIGTVDRKQDPTAVVTTNTNSPFRSFSLGGRHSCGVTESGKAYCWGRDPFGQLGNGSGDDSDKQIPVEVEMPTGEDGEEVDFESIDVGGNSSCALTTGGVAYCWGDNEGSELGFGPSGLAHEPTKVETSVTFESISTAGHQTCAIADGENGGVEAGITHCWGVNDTGGTGALGTGSNATFVTSPEKVTTSADDPLELAEVAVKGSTACGRTSSNELYCWGSNDDGQVAVAPSEQNPVTTPTLVSVGGSTDETANFGMAYFNVCAIRTQRTEAYCWGDNDRGQIGNANQPLGQETSSPMKIDLDAPLETIGGGWRKTCALTTEGQVYCWGKNDSSSTDALGTGNTAEDVRTPASVVCP